MLNFIKRFREQRERFISRTCWRRTKKAVQRTIAVSFPSPARDKVSKANSKRQLQSCLVCRRGKSSSLDKDGASDSPGQKIEENKRGAIDLDRRIL